MTTTVQDPRLAGRNALIDADCPSCGWPERLTPLDAPGSVFGCPKCSYVSEEPVVDAPEPEACVFCDGAGERPTGRTETGTGAPIMAECVPCDGTGTARLL